MSHPDYNTELLNRALAGGGFRMTQQREHVYQVLMEKRDHPTADEVFTRVKTEMPSISLATVYNCLEMLVECGLVRQVNHERQPTRYCPNLKEHGHFYCEECGGVYDVQLPPGTPESWKGALPQGFTISHFDFTVRGLCPECRENHLHSKITTL